MTENNQYIVSARKYRPATFRSVVGQLTLTNTLKNAISTDRLAQAYLFCGPRGVGKTSCARIFAKTINCTNRTPDGEACGECESCRAIERGNSFNIIELDAASNNGVDEIRNLTEQVNMPPQTGKYRVFIIDEVHMLSTQAFNAFLKTLEEPPRYAVFILATTEKHKVIPTILSRCQIYDFKRITIQDMVEHLEYVASQEGITAERSALEVIARKADGAMRDALSIFDQVAASSRGNITYQSTIENLNVLDYEYYFRLIDSFREGDAQKALLIYNEIRRKGFDSLFFINGLASHVRNLMMGADKRTSALIEAADDMIARYNEQAVSLPLQWYYTAMRLLSDCDLNYRTATDKQLLVELTLIRLSQLLKPVEPPFDRADYLPPLGNPFKQPTKVASPAPVSPASSAQNATTAPHPSDVKEEKAPNAEKLSVQESKNSTGAAPVRQRAKHHPGLNSGFSISEAAATTKVENHNPAERKDRAFTDEELIEVWNEFATINKDSLTLSAAMQSSRPVREDGATFKVLVSHPAEQQAFQASMRDILEFVREKLGNDLISFNVHIDETRQGEKKLTSHEFLKKVVAENPLIAELLKNIDAEMA